MPVQKILVTGSNGQLGSELQDLAANYPQLRFYFFNRLDFPIHDEEKARSIMKEIRPDFLINCAAYTAVDKAESEREVADAINAHAPAMLASICLELKSRFFHISTDYVFNGEASSPWKETDDTDPVNAYGASKWKGEQGVLAQNPESIIIRTSWVYSFFGKNFVRTMMRLMSEKPAISVVSDQVGSPTYAMDLAEVIIRVITSGKWVPGIYHFSNEGVISWFDFALEIKSLMNAACNITPIRSEEYPTPARRPRYSVLDKTRIVETFSLELKPWKESLAICMQKIANSPG
jgi:dTDP-4-dehydrorhamnose reductase